MTMIPIRLSGLYIQRNGFWSRASILIAGILILVYVIVDLLLVKVVDDTAHGIIDPAVPNDPNDVLIERVCTAAHCYVVRDRFISAATNSSPELVERCLWFDALQDADTCVFIQHPDEKSPIPFHESDSRLWRILASNLTSQYVAALAVAPVALDAIAFSTPSSALVIGLGGASLDGFWRTTLPNITIRALELDPVIVSLARRWFGVQEDGNYRIDVGDALHLIPEMHKSKADQQFSTIVLDACDNSECPAESLKSAVFFANLATMLSSRGVLLVNVLADQPAVETRTNELIAIITSPPVNLSWCMKIRVTREYNVILACGGAAGGSRDLKSWSAFLEQRFDAVARRMGADRVLGAVKLAAA